MSLFVVYDPHGEMFEVPHERAAQLVLNEGWTRSRPASAETVASPVHQPTAPVVIEPAAPEAEVRAAPPPPPAPFPKPLA